MDSTQIINNLFCSSDVVHRDENNNIIELNHDNISYYYSHIYVLLKKNNDIIPIEFYNLHINQEIYDEVASKLIIYKVSVKMLKNFYHYSNILLMDSEKLNRFNIFNYELEKKNIVIPIFNISYINLIKYLEQFESVNTLENIFKLKILNDYFQNNETEYLNNMISNLEESNYWTEYTNCKIYFSEKFNERTFSLNSKRIENAHVLEFASKNKHKSNYINDNYLSQLKYKKYTDISSLLYCSKTNTLLYHISSKSDFSRDEITKLFESLDNNQRFLLFCNLLINKKYAYLVINNYPILVMMTPTINKYPQLFSYLMSYTWLTFYIEECIKKSDMTISNNFIFDIDTASHLPVFPFNHSNPKINPYMPILVNDVVLDAKNNICGIPDYCINPESKQKSIMKNTNKRIANLTEFKVRMNIFCTRDPTLDLFENFDFSKYRIGISGSIITACLQVHHPLMSQFSNTDFIGKFNDYFDEYYPKSDIDIMFIADDLLTFINNANELYNQIVVNICKHSFVTKTDINPNLINLNVCKNANLFVTEKFIDKHIITNNKFDTLKQKMEYVKENLYNIEIYDQFVSYFKQSRQKYIDDFIKDFLEDEILSLKLKYPDFFDLENINYNIHIKHNIIPDSEIGINISYTIKFKITSGYLNHDLELFQINGNDFFAQVSRFHLPCVRGYYDGTTVYLTPSCISAHMTFMNLDYKYISGTKDPIDIINKYRSRGFGTWLNTAEKKLFIKYSSEIPYWKNMYNITENFSENEINRNILGTLHINNRFFRPRHFASDEYIDNNYVDTSTRYYNSSLPISISEFIASKSHINPYNELYIKRYPEIINLPQINYDHINAINIVGRINPLNKHIINYVYDLIKNNEILTNKSIEQIN